MTAAQHTDRADDAPLSAEELVRLNEAALRSDSPIYGVNNALSRLVAAARTAALTTRAGGAECCRQDHKPCYVGADTDEAHWRCGTSACRAAPTPPAVGAGEDVREAAGYLQRYVDSWADTPSPVTSAVSVLLAALAQPAAPTTGATDLIRELHGALASLTTAPEYTHLKRRALAALTAGGAGG